MRTSIADFMRRLANWLDGSGWNYDEFDHGYRAGAKAVRERYHILPELDDRGPKSPVRNSLGKRPRWPGGSLSDTY